MIGLTVQQRVGMRVQAARKVAGLTQQQVADRIGLTRTSVVNLEAGRQDTPLSRLAILAEVLKLDLGDLIREGDLPSPPHDVTVRRVYEVNCDTCGGVIDCHSGREKALESKRDHIAEMRGTS